MILERMVQRLPYPPLELLGTLVVHACMTVSQNDADTLIIVSTKAYAYNFSDHNVQLFRPADNLIDKLCRIQIGVINDGQLLQHIHSIDDEEMHRF